MNNKRSLRSGRRISGSIERFPSTPSQSSCVTNVSVTTSKISNTKMAKFNEEKRARDKIRRANRKSKESFDEKADLQTEIITVWPSEEKKIHDYQQSQPSIHSSKSKKTSQSKSSSSSLKSKKSTQLKQSSSNESTTSTSNGQANRFQMMDITITILEISGIVSNEIAKEKRNQSKISKLKNITKSLSLPNSPKSVTEQNTDNHAGNSLPIFALATFTRNTIDSSTSISTHIPSLSLKNEVSRKNIHSLKHRAIWPYSADYDEKRSTKRSAAQQRIQKNDSRNRSSYKFSRVLEREETDKNNKYDSKMGLKFTPSLVDIQVGLICGEHMIHLGTTRVVIPGETNETEHILPVHKILETKQTSMLEKATYSNPFGKSKISIRKNIRFLGKVNRSNSCTFGKKGTRSFKIDDNASIRILLDVCPQKGNSQQRIVLREGGTISSPFDKLSIEVGTDNVANLWKIAPQDTYEVVEYSPPSKEEEVVDRILQNVNELNCSKNSAVSSGSLQSSTPSNSSTPKSSHSTAIQSPPDISSKRFNKWNCLDPTLDFYDADNDDLELIEDERFLSQDTWDTTVNDETVKSNISFDDDKSLTDENTHDHTNEDDTDEDDTHSSWNDSYTRTFDSHDDTQTETTYDSIFFSLDSNNESILIAKDGAVNDTGKKKIDVYKVHKARETLRKFADRIGVNPEDLI